MTKYTAPTVPMSNIHVDLLRGMHPVHLLSKYHLTVRELASVVGTLAGKEWACEAPRERGHAYWKAYFRRNQTLSVK
jgi:esterase/lipase